MSINLDELLVPVKRSKVNTAVTGGAPKILTLDLETAPIKLWAYSTYGINYVSPDQVIEPSRILSFAAKWLDQKKTTFASEYHDGEEVMLDKLWQLLDQADILITYNGDGFDIKWVNGAFLRAGLTPPSPYKSVDLYKAVRRFNGFTHRRLGVVCQALGIGGKVEHGGFTMWKQILEDNDPKAWALCKKYNIQDVLITENLFWRLLPWLKGTPHRGLWSGVERCCHACGSESLEQHGWHQTAITRYARLQCQDCGAWNRATYVRTRPITRPIA